jgi:hypothetical protein
MIPILNELLIAGKSVSRSFRKDCAMAGALFCQSRTLQGEKMLKMHDSTVRRSIRKFEISAAHKMAKSGLAVVLAGIIFSVLAFGQQSQREYIYMNGKAIATETSAAACSYAISPASASIAATAGTGTVSVSSGSGCSWTASSNAAWITVTAGSSGSGNGTVSYSVSSNTGSARSGTLTIAGQTFTINQASGCTYTLNPASAYYSTDGSTGSSFTVATASACSWTATSNSSWITITAGSSGTGNGTVTYSVAANSADARDGTISVGNSIHYVSQDAFSTCDLECANACMAQYYPYEYCALLCNCP